MPRPTRNDRSRPAAPPRLPLDGFLPASASIRVDQHDVDGAYPAHWHEFHELFLVTAGAGTHLRNGVAQPLRPGSVGLLTPADLHAFRADPGGLKLMNVVFSGAMTPGGGPGFPMPTAGPMMPTAGAALRADLDRIAGELAERRRGWRVVVRATLERVLVDMQRLTAGTDIIGGDAIARPPAPTSAAVRAGIAIVEQEFAAGVSLAEVAARVHLSPAYLSERFHAETGQPFSAYRRGLQLRFAAGLLTDGGLQVTEVCHRAGFANPAHFARAFRRRFGCSPSAYRARHADHGHALT